MNKRLAAIVLCLVLLAVTACGGSGSKDKQNEKDADAGATQEVQEVEKYTPAVHEEGKYYVGIIQQAPHEALDLTGEGFRKMW